MKFKPCYVTFPKSCSNAPELKGMHPVECEFSIKGNTYKRLIVLAETPDLVATLLEMTARIERDKVALIKRGDSVIAVDVALKHGMGVQIVSTTDYKLAYPRDCRSSWFGINGVLNVYFKLQEVQDVD